MSIVYHDIIFYEGEPEILSLSELEIEEWLNEVRDWMYSNARPELKLQKIIDILTKEF